MEIISFKIGNYKLFKNFEIDFSNKDGSTKNIIILAGINGSGKTTLLEYIKKKVEDFNFDKTGYLNVLTEFDKDDNFFVLGGIDGIKSIRLDKDLNNTIKEHKKDNTKDCIYYNSKGKTSLIEQTKVELFINAISQIQKKIIFLRAETYNYKRINNFIFSHVKRLVFEQEKTPKQAYKHIQLILDEIFEDFNLRIRFGSIDTSWDNGKEEFHVYFKNENCDKILLSNLSTGEKELIMKALYLEISCPQNAIILIDEPEKSLHPRWQQQILQVYERIARKYDSQFIIATHSPHIIASTNPQNLYLLDIDTSGDISKIQIMNMHELEKHTKGVEPNRILQEIMGVTSLRHNQVELKMSQLIELLTLEDFDKESTKELIDELSELLGNNDPFLIRVHHQIRVLERKILTMV